MVNLVEELWQLLDDIDTASDMFKPEKTAFYEYVMAKANERHKYLISDGYTDFPLVLAQMIGLFLASAKGDKQEKYETIIEVIKIS